jgi:tetrapyrrole methylase family protein / MazG family protein
VTPAITVVGLGPGGADLLTQGTVAALGTHTVCRLRTRVHPAAESLCTTLGEIESFDHLYESLDSFDEVYSEIVEQLVLLAESSAPEPVLYAVPGSPLVAERTVEMLLADPRVTVTVVPALSYLDLTWARLRVDPHAYGVRVVDGLRFAEEADGERGPLLVSQCHSLAVLSDIKCTPTDPPSHVTVLQRLGLPDESIVEIAWDDLDRVIEPDHLTSLWIPTMPTPLRTEMARLVSVMARVNAECPWYAEQTHMSLAPYAIEEAYELAEAIAADAAEDAGNMYTDDLIGEIGDVLFQAVFHACLGNEDGRFSLADVARVLSDKLIRRNPHVFDGLAVEDADDVVQNWEAIKSAERGDVDAVSAGGMVDPMAGLTEALPSLSYAAKVIKRATAAGFAVEGAVLPTPDDAGGYLLSVVATMKANGQDPELELRLAAARFRDHVRAEHHLA